jgi:hypothetical protein
MNQRNEIITWDEVSRLIDHLLPQFNRVYTVMVMITRGGIIPGGMLAEAMNVQSLFTPPWTSPPKRTPPPPPIKIPDMAKIPAVPGRQPPERPQRADCRRRLGLRTHYHRRQKPRDILRRPGFHMRAALQPLSEPVREHASRLLRGNHRRAHHLSVEMDRGFQSNFFSGIH